MKKLYYLIIITLAATSCVQVAFEAPQPANAEFLQEIPSGFHGDYTLYIMGEKAQVEIGKNYIHSDEEKGTISDSIVVKYADGRLFINKRIFHQDRTFWEFYTLEDKGCGLFKGTMIVAGDDDMIATLEGSYDTELVESEGGGDIKKFLLINPKRDELNKLLEGDAAYSVYLEKNGN